MITLFDKNDNCGLPEEQLKRAKAFINNRFKLLLARKLRESMTDQTFEIERGKISDELAYDLFLNYHSKEFTCKKFDFEIIKQFQPETTDIEIYDFGPETIPLFLLKTATRKALQFKDLQNAHEYAEKEILPLLTQNTRTLESSDFVLGFKQMHRLLSKSLAEDKNLEHACGEITDDLIMRWQQGHDIAQPVYVEFTSDIAMIPLRKNDITSLVRHYSSNVKPNILSNPHFTQRAYLDDFEPNYEFIALVFNLNKENYPVPENLLNRLNSQCGLKPGTKFPPNILVCKLIQKYRDNKFSESEKSLIESVVLLPQTKVQIERDLDDLAKYCLTQLPRLVQRNSNSVDINSDIIEFISTIFRRFTKIHPFFNSNGREATLLINLALVAKGYPSILLRNHDDRDNKQSLYHRAINEIDRDGSLLKEHLTQRLNEALKKDSQQVLDADKPNPITASDSPKTTVSQFKMLFEREFIFSSTIIQDEQSNVVQIFVPKIDSLTLLRFFQNDITLKQAFKLIPSKLLGDNTVCLQCDANLLPSIVASMQKIHEEKREFRAKKHELISPYTEITYPYSAP